MATIKGQLKQKTANGSDILHPETEADLVTYSNSIGDTSVTTVKGALDTIISAGVGVTGVKGDAETDYRSGDVNLTPANIGAVAANSSITGATKCKITYDSKGLVTAGADLAVSDLPSNIPASKITGLGAAASMNVTTSATGIWPSSTDDTLVTAKAVHKAIDALPDPMEFMGTLGTDGTITALQPPAAVKKGWTYKVIDSGEYSYTKASGTGKVIAKEGDVVINNGTDWILIPSGDDIEDTWRGIKVNGTPKLGNGISTGDVDFVNGGNVTVSFNSTGNKITLGVASDYSIPSNDDQAAWSAKQNALAAQTEYTAKGTTTKVPQITTNSLGQVTLIEEKNIAFPNIVVDSSITGSGNAVTAIAVDTTNKHKLKITKGETFVTTSGLSTALNDYFDLDANNSVSGANTFTNVQTIQVSDSDDVGLKVKVPSNQGANYTDIKPEGIEIFSAANATWASIDSSGITNHVFGASGGTDWTEYKISLPSKAGTILLSSDIGTSVASQSSVTTIANNYATKASPTAGVYSAVQINSEGIVTAGKQLWEVIENGASTADIVVGGLYFEKVAA